MYLQRKGVLLCLSDKVTTKSDDVRVLIWSLKDKCKCESSVKPRSLYAATVPESQCWWLVALREYYLHQIISVLSSLGLLTRNANNTSDVNVTESFYWKTHHVIQCGVSSRPQVFLQLETLSRQRKNQNCATRVLWQYRSVYSAIITRTI